MILDEIRSRDTIIITLLNKVIRNNIYPISTRIVSFRRGSYSDRHVEFKYTIVIH